MLTSPFLYVWLDVGRRHQPNHMAQPGKNATPVMSCRTGLYPDQARRQSLEETGDLIAVQLPTKHCCSGGIDSMNLKDLLGYIKTDCANILHGRFSLM